MGSEKKYGETKFESFEEANDEEDKGANDDEVPMEDKPEKRVTKKG